MKDEAMIQWEEEGETRSLRWRSLAGAAAPKRVVVADDRMTADSAYRLACEGTALLWRGDFQNARQLLQALARRVDQRPKRSAKVGKAGKETLTPVERFHQYRLAQSQRARTLGMLLLPFDAGYRIPLRRAPDVQQACLEAYAGAGEGGEGAEGSEPYAASMRELLGIISAHEWRKAGVEIPVLGAGARIHAHYGVFSPVRGEYLDLVARAPLPAALRETPLAFDIGTGTGVLAALLAQRGVARIVATDQDGRALACARENVDRLGLADRIEVVAANLFPEGRAALAVCNPPWLPGRPASPLEHAIYDLESRMLLGFLRGLPAHLVSGGEGWLILSDLAEHLGLRRREELLNAITAAGLRVLERLDIKPRHGRVSDVDDPLHAARKAEITSLWRLAV